MLGDAKKNKISAKILVYLVEYILDEIYTKIHNTKSNIEQFEDTVKMLHDIEKIYKEIYDRGFNPKLEKKLKKYELAPGYDMSTNANLLVLKQKALEKEKEKLSELEEEEKIIQGQYEELYELARKENWYKNEKYYK